MFAIELALQTCIEITIQYVTSDNTLSIRDKMKLNHYLRICPKANYKHIKYVKNLNIFKMYLI